MKLSLPLPIQALIDEQVKSGRYASPEDVVAAAVLMLEQQKKLDEFATGELDALLAEGERDIERGDVLDIDKAFEALKRISNTRRQRNTAG
jgi:putative addiction module CopG family antidote